MLEKEDELMSENRLDWSLIIEFIQMLAAQNLFSSILTAGFESWKIFSNSVCTLAVHGSVEKSEKNVSTQKQVWWSIASRTHEAHGNEIFWRNFIEFYDQGSAKEE